jgi:Kef-type K+ transport system membrane component KefB
MAMGPRGLNVLPESLLVFLDPAVSAALATLGALAGLGLYRDRGREPALLTSVVVDVALVIVVVGGCAAAMWRVIGLTADATWIAAACLAIAAVASTAGIRSAAHPFATLISRIGELGTAVAIVLGTLALAWLRHRSPAGSLLMTAELCAIAAMIGLAGWLLAGQTSDDNEQRVFAAGTVLLLGGAAEYLAASALFLGLVAGACWRMMGGAASERMTRDLEYLQHPLVVLLLIIAGAKCEFSAGAMALVAAYVLFQDRRETRVRLRGEPACIDRPPVGARPVAAPDRRGRRCVRAEPGCGVGESRRAPDPRRSRSRHAPVRGAGDREYPAGGGMTRLAAVALVVAALFLVRRIGIGGAAAAESGTALPLGFTLVVALVSGEILRRFRLPKLTGYLLFGLLLGPYLGNVITVEMARQLQTVTGVSTALIAFIAGLTLNFERLGRRAHGVVRVIATTLTIAMAGLFAVVWLVWPWLPIAPDAHGLGKLVIAALFVVVVISFSPTMSAAVIAETGARGRMSDLVLAIVVVADLGRPRPLLGADADRAGDARRQSGREQRPADAGVGDRRGARVRSLVGALLALYLRYVARESTLVLLGACVLLSQVGATQRFEPLLAAMAAGMVISNIAVPQGDALQGRRSSAARCRC